MLRIHHVLTLLVASVTLAVPGFAQFPTPAPNVTRHIGTVQTSQLGHIRFEPNVGQTDANVDFLARGAGYTVFLQANQAMFALEQYEADSHLPQPKQAIVQMVLDHANASPNAEGVDKLPGVVNYLSGSDKNAWRTHIPTYSTVAYRRVYPGVDLIYHGTPNQLEYDFNVAPKANPKQISLHFVGANAIQIEKSGALALTIGTRTMRWQRPNIYQTVRNKKQPITGSYVLRDDKSVGFTLGKYDQTKPLVIDPIVAYATFLGGSTIDDANCIAVDAQGFAYIAGYPGSTLFPTTLGIYNVHISGGFVSKLSPDGSTVLYTTYFGGRSAVCNSIAVDSMGHVFVSGNTRSYLRSSGTYKSDFPVTATALPSPSETKEETYSGFVAEFDPSGASLLYGTLMTGDQGVNISKIDVDGEGALYVLGATRSTEFLGVSMPAPPVITDLKSRILANSTTFVAKLDLTKSGQNALVYLKLFHANSKLNVFDFKVTADGKIAIAGSTSATDFPTTSNAYQQTYIKQAPSNSLFPSTEGFVVLLDSDGQTPIYSTYWGGATNTHVSRIALGADGKIFILGSAGMGLPTTPEAYQHDAPPEAERRKFVKASGYVAKFDPKKSGAESLVYATYFGGNSPCSPTELAVNAAGDAYVAGTANDATFPTTADAIQPIFNPRSAGAYSAFLSILSPMGDRLLWSSFLGQGGMTDPRGLAVDSDGSAYLCGVTTYNLLPTTLGAHLIFAPGGATDGFAMKVSGMMPPGPAINSLSPYPIYAGLDRQLTINGAGFDSRSVVTFNHGQPQQIISVSPNQIVARIPADVANTLQAAIVTVTAPGQNLQASALMPVVDPAPSIVVLTPPYFHTKADFSTLKIYGIGFTPKSLVSFNGLPPISLVYDTPIGGAVIVPKTLLETPGTIDVAVTNPDAPQRAAHASLIVTDKSAVPVLTALSLYRMKAGSPAFALTIYGSGFDWKDTIIINGTSYKSSGLSEGLGLEYLYVTIPASLLVNPGWLRISVDNTPLGGGISNTLDLKVF